ncbi:MAG TPA: hypothetical protein VK389_02595, partial [Thermoanaerobaculia bacterium]|nr:hypothetical protein [Thermoanaerobaculia bacterium]
LRSAGVGLARLRRCEEALRRLGGDAGNLGGVRLLVAGSRVLWARSDREVVDLLKEGQLVLVFSLDDAVRETAGAVARLNRENARDANLSQQSRGKQSF